jgi:hypothetical protein
VSPATSFNLLNPNPRYFLAVFIIICPVGFAQKFAVMRSAEDLFKPMITFLFASALSSPIPTTKTPSTSTNDHDLGGSPKIGVNIACQCA